MPGPRYHTVIFVQVDEDGSGYTHHAIGDLITGMRYDCRRDAAPEASENFHSKEFVGWVAATRYPRDFERAFQAQRAPLAQKKFNPRTYRTEQFDLATGQFYAPLQPRPRLIKCTEWALDQVLPALLASGLLVPP